MDRLNQHLFALAAYNAGPARVAKLRQEAAKLGLNANVWFGNVEVIAARRIGRETVQYVRNIYKYYIAYRLIVDRLEKQASPAAAPPSRFSKRRLSKAPNGCRPTHAHVRSRAVADTWLS